MSNRTGSSHFSCHSSLMRQLNKKQHCPQYPRPLNPLKFEAKMPLAMRRLAQSV